MDGRLEFCNYGLILLFRIEFEKRKERWRNSTSAHMKGKDTLYCPIIFANKLDLTKNINKTEIDAILHFVFYKTYFNSLET